MDKNWAEKNKEVQKLLSKEITFKEAVQKLIAFREEMFTQITQIVDAYPDEAFSLMPYAGADGYHSKTLAYSIWHIFRIEDIVAHEMIAGDEQMPFSRHWVMHIEAMRRIKNRLCKFAGFNEHTKSWNL